MCAAVVRQVHAKLYTSPERCQACCISPLAQQLQLSVDPVQILSKLLLQPYLQPAVLASAWSGKHMQLTGWQTVVQP